LQKTVFGAREGPGWSQNGPQKSVFFYYKKLLKSYEIIAKNKVRGTTPSSQNYLINWFSFVLPKNVVFHNPWFYLSQTEVFEGEGHYF